jgi:hypothetical protein
MGLKANAVAALVAAIMILVTGTARAQALDAALVIAIDVSGSVSDERFGLHVISI